MVRYSSHRARPRGLYGNLGARLPGKLLKNTIKNATSLQKYREGGGGGQLFNLFLCPPMIMSHRK